MKLNWERSTKLFVFSIIFLMGLVGLLNQPAQAQTGEGAVHVLEIKGVINPPAANYLQRALREAREENASLVVFMLDTPGGLDTSMREMTQAMLNSPVPVVVYVAPSGSRAASAGLFLLMASHVAAMAPGTNTGAAHPVGIGGDPDDVSITKAVEDASATIRALAVQHGRNADWAERAVRESLSVTEQEALDLQVIDVVARNLDQLLEQIDGMTIQTALGEVVLDVQSAPRKEVSMNFAENFLHVISDPNIAFILLSVGTIGIIAELYNPGALFPGITGAISLILAFFSLGNLPTNWAGVALIVLAIILLIAELSTEGTGILGIGGLVAFVLGALFLFQPFRPASPALPDLRVNPWVLGLATASLGSFMFVVMAQIIRSRHAPILTGKEQFVGQIATVRSDLNPRGRVWFEGQGWFAEEVSGKHIPSGKEVRIVDIQDLTLIVKSIEED